MRNKIILVSNGVSPYRQLKQADNLNTNAKNIQTMETSKSIFDKLTVLLELVKISLEASSLTHRHFTN